MKLSQPCVYCFFDAHGRSLYVGRTDDFFYRASQHQREKPWFKQVHHAMVSHARNPACADRCERIMIWSMQPAFNKMRPPLKGWRRSSKIAGMSKPIRYDIGGIRHGIKNSSYRKKQAQRAWSIAVLGEYSPYYAAA